MARATFVKSARKDYPEQGIKKGESYYWWKFRYGGKRFSKKPPRPSQLTGSDFLSTVYAALESVEDCPLDDAEAAALCIRDASEQIQEAGDDQGDKVSNMPDGLQQGEVAQMMEQRQSDCEQLAGDLEQIADDLDDLAERLAEAKGEESEKKEGDDAEEKEDVDEILGEITAKVEEAQALSYDGE